MVNLSVQLVLGPPGLAQLREHIRGSPRAIQVAAGPVNATTSYVSGLSTITTATLAIGETVFC